MAGADPHPHTPDGRYFVVKGRLWRLSNPDLAPERREALVKQLMAARREVGAARKTGDKQRVRRWIKPSMGSENVGPCGGPMVRRI